MLPSADTPAPRADATIAWLAGALLAVLFILRIATLSWDVPPGLGAGAWPEPDEGWYAKGALLLSRWAVVSQPLDLTAWTHNPLWTAVLAALFSVAGASLVAARAVGVAAELLALAMLWSIVRTRMPRGLSALVCLAAYGTVHALVWGRQARPYELGIALSLAALVPWVCRPTARASPALSLALAWLAVGAKFFFGFSAGFVTLLWLGEAWSARRAGQPRRAGAIAAALLFVTAAGVAALLALRLGAAGDWNAYQDEAIGRHLDLGRGAGFGLIGREREAICVHVAPGLGAPVLAIAIGAGLLAVLWAWLRDGGPRVLPSRATVALVGWALTGLLLVGLSHHQPRRYFTFALGPFAYAAAIGVRAFVGARVWPGLWTAVVVLHLALQAPATLAFARQSDPSRSARIERRIARRTARDGPGTVVMGRFAATVALFDARLRPIELGFVAGQPYDLCDRIRRHRPRWLLLDGGDDLDERVELTQACPELVEAVVVEGRHDFGTPSRPLTLARIALR